MQQIRTGKTILEDIQTEDGPDTVEVQVNTSCFKGKNGDLSFAVTIIDKGPSVASEKLTKRLERLAHDLVRFGENPYQESLPLDGITSMTITSGNRSVTIGSEDVDAETGEVREAASGS